MTWKELGTGLQAVRDGRDLPYRVAEGLIGLGYVTPGATTNDFRPTLTERGQHWLDTWEGTETGLGTLTMGVASSAVRDSVRDVMAQRALDPRD